MSSEKFNVKQVPKEIRKHESWSRRAYVDWVNNKLKSNYTNALQFRNGALYIQLIDSLFPGAVNMDDVKCSADMEYDCYQNFRILEDAFKRLGIDKHVDARALSSGRHVENWSFLRWFKTFYDHNFEGQFYDPILGRKNAYMGFGKPPENLKKTGTLRGKPNEPNHRHLTRRRSKSLILEKEPRKYDLSGGKEAKSDNCRRPETPTEWKDNHGEKYKIFPYRDFRNRSSIHAFEELHRNRNVYRGKNSEINVSRSSVSTTPNMDSEETSSTVRSPHIILRKRQSRGDFEPRIMSKLVKPEEKENVNPIVVDKSLSYEDFGVRITENIQIRVDSSEINSGKDDPERRRKINLMIEKFLKSKCIEHKEYFQTLAEFISNNEVRNAIN